MRKQRYTTTTFWVWSLGIVESKKRMKRFTNIITFPVVAGVFLLLGWYLGYTRPAHRNLRLIKAETGLDEAGIIKLCGEMKTIVQNYEDEEEYVAALAANALSALSTGNVSRANQWLILPVASHYVDHLANVPISELPKPRQKLRRRIEQTMLNNKQLRSKIEEQLKDTAQKHNAN
jgi:hypothetical protein